MIMYLGVNEVSYTDSYKDIKMDSVQSLSNMCKNYFLKIYSQHSNFLNAI